MPEQKFTRANSAVPPVQGPLTSPRLNDGSDLSAIAQHIYNLMMRNIASDGYVFQDPVRQGLMSMPGCVLAAPSYPMNTPGIDQDYVYHWTRDSATVAMELIAAAIPANPGGGVQPLIDYVFFSQKCQTSGNNAGHFARASFTIDGRLRDSSDQTDGPALQTVALLDAHPKLDTPTQAIALDFFVGSLCSLSQVSCSINAIRAHLQ